MKIFNLTDVETPALAQRGLLNQSIAVGDKMIPPGGSEEVDDATFERVQPSLQEFVMLGVMACGELPDAYKIAQAAAQPAAPVTPPRSGGFAKLPAPPAEKSEKNEKGEKDA